MKDNNLKKNYKANIINVIAKKSFKFDQSDRVLRYI